MSRIGKRPVEVPSGVKVQLTGRNIQVEGPKGKIAWEHHRMVSLKVEDSKVTVRRSSKTKLAHALHGTTRQLLHNMMVGVTTGFQRNLEIVGVGYNAKVEKDCLVLQIGFCHPVEMPIPEGLHVEVPRPTDIRVEGIDKQLVGQFAADVRRVRPPEPYKGKGIRYKGEEVRRKAAKSFAGGG